MKCKLFTVEDNPFVEWKNGNFDRKKYYCSKYNKKWKHLDGNWYIDSDTEEPTKYSCDEKYTAGADSDFFHATKKKNIKSIKKKGLLSNTMKMWREADDNAIYFSNDMASAISWAFYSAMLGEEYKDLNKMPIVLLKISDKTMQEKYADKYKYDEAGTLQSLIPATSYRLMGVDIPPEDLEILTRDGWMPLKQCGE